MKLSKVFSWVFLVVALGLAYFLIDSIRTAIEEEDRIKRVEAAVIEKLKVIREAQIAYQSVYGEYSSDWASLKEFMRNGDLYIIERTEETKLLEYGAEETIVTIDTIGIVAVSDSIFSEERYPSLNIDRLQYIPGSNGKEFELFADKIEKGNVLVAVVEVKDSDPVDKTRVESNPNNRKPLRFGSRVDVTTSGNWE